MTTCAAEAWANFQRSQPCCGVTGQPYPCAYMVALMIRMDCVAKTKRTAYLLITVVDSGLGFLCAVEAVNTTGQRALTDHRFVFVGRVAEREQVVPLCSQTMTCILVLQSICAVAAEFVCK